MIVPMIVHDGPLPARIHENYIQYSAANMVANLQLMCVKTQCEPGQEVNLCTEMSLLAGTRATPNS